MFDPKCPNCGSEDVSEVHPLFLGTEPGDELHVDLRTCRDCDLTVAAEKFEAEEADDA